MEREGKKERRNEEKEKKKGGGRGLNTNPNHVPSHPKHFWSFPSNKMYRDGVERWMKQVRKMLGEECPLLYLFFFFLSFCYFFGPLLRHMEVPRLGVESEL